MKMLALLGALVVMALIIAGAWLIWKWAIEADRRMGARERRNWIDE